MSYIYEHRNKRENERRGAEPFSGGKVSSLPNSAMVENPGHQVDMPVVMREKMEDSFGMDLSGVKLYENKAVGKAGAEAVTQGSKIVFAPGKLDFSSIQGQALLGHEISHVASQARGEVKGSGLVNDSVLEARADREGLMAARGESLAAPYGGASAALSSASAASASGPMQAKSGKKKPKKQSKEMDMWQKEMESMNSMYSTKEADADLELDQENDVDRLYRIQAAMMREGAQENPDNPLLQKGDYEWYKQMQKKPNQGIFSEIQKRTMQSAKNLVNFRDWMEDPDLEFDEFTYHGERKKNLKRSKKNYNASYSNEGLDYDIYKSLMESMKLPMNINDEPEHIDPILEEADRIQSARNLNDKDGNENPEAAYLKEYYKIGSDNQASTRFDKMRKEARLNRFDEIATGKNKKEMTAEEEQIQKDLDSLYAIYSGFLADEKLRMKDRVWYTNLTKDPNSAKKYFKGLMDRIYDAKIQLGKNWEKAGGKSLSQKQSFEITQNDEAMMKAFTYGELLKNILGDNNTMTSDEQHNMYADYEAQLSANDQAGAIKGNKALLYSYDFVKY